MGFGTPVVFSKIFYHPPLIVFFFFFSRITLPCPLCSLSTGINTLHLGRAPLLSFLIVHNLFYSSYPVLPLTEVQKNIIVINNAPMEFLRDINHGLAYIRYFQTAWPYNVPHTEIVNVLHTFGLVIVSHSCSSYQHLSDFSLPS